VIQDKIQGSSAMKNTEIIASWVETAAYEQKTSTASWATEDFSKGFAGQMGDRLNLLIPMAELGTRTFNSTIAAATMAAIAIPFIIRSVYVSCVSVSNTCFINISFSNCC
jgi:hypothetical protein